MKADTVSTTADFAVVGITFPPAPQNAQTPVYTGDVNLYYTSSQYSGEVVVSLDAYEIDPITNLRSRSVLYERYSTKNASQGHFSIILWDTSGTSRYLRNTFFVPGKTYEFEMMVDDFNKIAETNENNNIYSARYTFPNVMNTPENMELTKKKQDFSVKKITYRKTSLTKNDFNGIVGTGMRVIAEVEGETNIKTSDEPELQVSINNTSKVVSRLSSSSFSNNKWKTSFDVYMKVNTSTGEIVRNPYGLQEGTLSSGTIIVDPSSSVSDVNRANNYLVTSYTLPVTPTQSFDFAIKNFKLRTEILEGGIVIGKGKAIYADIEVSSTQDNSTLSPEINFYTNTYSAFVPVSLSNNASFQNKTWKYSAELYKNVKTSTMEVSRNSFGFKEGTSLDIYAQIDPKNIMKESDENNNVKKLSYTLSPFESFIDASCGSAAKTYLANEFSYTGSFCSSGKVTTNPPFPESSNVTAIWVCEGNGGGKTVACRAEKSSSTTVPSNSNSTTQTSKTPIAGFEEEEVKESTASLQNPFSDVSATTLLGKAAIEMYHKGIVGGYSDGTFKGYKSVNRAEITKFLLLAKYGISAVSDIRNNGTFLDVLEGEWYTKFVMTAFQKGLITGYPDGTFGPSKSVNTVEFLTFLARTFNLQESLGYSYSDVSSSVWYAKYAGIAAKYNLFPGRNAGYLNPEQSLTREEVVVALYQYFHNK